MSFLTDTFSAIADVSVAFAPPAASVLARLSDQELIAAQGSAAEVRRRSDAVSAALANEIAHRSRRELGHSGLAPRLGAANAEALVQRITGASAPEARSLVKAGALLPVDETRADAAAQPSWLGAVGEALAAGRLSAAGASAIQAGLGAESDAVSAGDLALAAATLLREASAPALRGGSLTVEQLGQRARDLRTELDLAGVAEREEARREKRYLRFTRQDDGMTRVNGLLDPESAAVVVPIFDAITSPRRGGPRFVDPDDVERAEKMSRDPRTNDQITLDAFVELVRLGSSIDDGALLGTTRPTVSLLVTHRELAAGRGFASLEGQSEPVSLQTAERHLCNGDIIPMLFAEDGDPLRFGRTRRTFSRAQRRALAARDGGCRFPGCTLPPAWTEAHHILEWLRHAGLTDIDNGILLCRFHHLLIHNNGWTITRKAGDFYVVPPASVDPERRPIPAPSKSPPLRRLLATP